MATKQTIAIAFKATDNTKAAFRSVESSMGKMQRAGAALSAALAPLSGAAVVAGLAAMGKKAVETGDKIHKMSKRLGVSTEALSQYRHVANLSGTSLDTLANGVRLSQKAIADAGDGLSTATRALGQMGLSVEQLRAMRPEDAFEAMGEAMAGISDQSTRMQVAMAVFGRAGAELIPVFEGGAGAVKAMRQEADDLNLTLSQDQADAAARAADAITRLKGAWEGFLQASLIDGADQTTSRLENMLRWATSQSKLDTLKWQLQQIKQTADDLSGWSPAMAGVAAEIDDLTEKHEKFGWKSREAMDAYSLAITNFINKYNAAKDAVAGGMIPSGASDGGAQFGPFFDERDENEVSKRMAAIRELHEQLLAEAAAIKNVEDAFTDSQLAAEARARVHLENMRLAAEDVVLTEEEHAEVVAALEYGYSQMAEVADGTFGQIETSSENAANKVSSDMSRAAMTMQNTFESAITQMVMSLNDLENAAKSIFDMVVSTAIRLGVRALLTSATGGAGAAVPGGDFLGPIPGITSAGSGRTGITVGSLNVNVAGQFSSDPVSVRKMADQLHRELLKISSYHGPREVTA